jgi:hypothetical protein
MPRTKISEFSATAADNTDINGINLAEGMLPSDVNNSIRELMAQIKDLQAGTSGDSIPVTAGGTSLTTLTANNVILGNGTSAPLFVAPGTSGNVLTSNGTSWTSAEVPAGGLTYLYKTANYTAVDKEGVLADTAGGSFTVTLPATPTTGVQVVVADAGGAWGTNNLTVGRNGSTISGLAENLVCDITGASVQLVYDGTTWEVYSQVGGNGGTAVTLDGVQTLTNKTINGSSNTLSNISLSTAVTGTLPAANGGTGVTSAGTSGNVLTSDGTNWTSAAPSGGADLQEFTASGTYTKPAGATFVMVECWGGGGGGGSGRLASGETNVSGGGGGGGGSYTYRLFKASDLAATESVTIGAGGAGGAAVVSANGNGNDGSDGGNTTFGSFLSAYGGGDGKGGVSINQAFGGTSGGVLSAGLTAGGAPRSINVATNATSASVTGQFGGLTQSTGLGQASGFGGGGGAAASAANPGNIGGSSYQGGAGGGGGGGVNNSDVPQAGGDGGSKTGANGGGGAGGAIGSNGVAGTTLGFGGGGGGGATSAAGGTGGTGGIAAGGGGGGGSITTSSGAGGAGGNGLVRVYTW